MRLRNRQRGERSVDDAGQQRVVGLALLRADELQHPALRTVDLLQLFDRHAAGCREAERRLGRLTARVECVRDRRALALDLLIGLMIGDAGDAHCESPRRCKPFDARRA